MNYIHTNEYLECLNSLMFVSELTRKLKTTPYYWKWVIISFHNAIQSLMVMSLQGTNGLLTLKKKSEEAWLKSYYEGSQNRSKLELDNFLNLYDKIKSTNHLSFEHSKQYCPPGNQDFSVKTLNSLRNDFIHFGSRFWSVEISGLPKIILDCLDIAIFQCEFSGTIFFTDSRPREPLLNELYNQNVFFGELKVEYEKLAEQAR